MKKQYHFKTTCYLLFLLVIITSCSKQITAGLMDQTLSGTWNWVKTDGGFANNVHDTPSSTGKNVDIKFTADKQYFIYTNGTQTSQGTFTLDVRNCIHDHTNKNVIHFSQSTDHDMMIEKMDSLHLELSDDAYDGTGSLYIRK